MYGVTCQSSNPLPRDSMRLLVRGTPALVLYRVVLDARKRAALALMSSTQLPPRGLRLRGDAVEEVVATDS